MSETRSIFPDFHKDLTRDPGGENRLEVGPEEMAEVTNLFNQTFESWLSKYNQKIKHETMADGQIVSRLLKGIQFEDRMYTLAVEEVTDRPPGSPPVEGLLPSEDIKRAMTFQLLIGDQPSDMSSYRLCRDGIVRRYDIDAEINHMQGIMVNKDIQAATDQDDHQRRVLAAQNNHQDNTRFAEKMGVNNQPVGLEELDGLSQFLNQVSQPQPQQQQQQQQQPQQGQQPPQAPGYL